MSCPQLFFLNGEAHFSVCCLCHHLVFTFPYNDIDIVKTSFPHDVNHVIDHFLAADLVKDLGRGGFHPLPFACSED